MKKYLEIETKYKAEDIPLSKFHEFCKKNSPVKYTEASGWDHFYANRDDKNDSFCRLRIGPDIFQLTFKSKMASNNNYVRHEDNIDLSVSTSRPQVESFLDKFGYNYNTSIFKSCFVYRYSWWTMVFYVCYDVDMHELGRFLEIEMSEEYEWSSEQDAWNQLVVLEKLAKPLGLSPQARIKRSLFELFQKP